MITFMLLLNYIGLTSASLCQRDGFYQHFVRAQWILERNKTVDLMYNTLEHCEFEEMSKFPTMMHCISSCHAQAKCYAFNVSSSPLSCQFCLDFGNSDEKKSGQELSGVYVKSEVLKDNCVNISCENNGNCSNTPSGFYCECVQGYEGKLCQTNIDECASSPCNEGSCTDNINGYTCECVIGYMGTNCENTVIKWISIVGNMAYGSSQSSDYPNWTPDKVVDGNTNGYIFDGSCYHSEFLAPLWWAVHLGQDMYVSSVKIYNRIRCCGDRLQRFRAYVSSDTFNPVISTDKQLCAEMPGIYPDAQVAFNCIGSLQGRYLSLSFDFMGVAINFCEVQVKGFFEEDL